MVELFRITQKYAPEASGEEVSAARTEFMYFLALHKLIKEDNLLHDLNAAIEGLFEADQQSVLKSQFLYKLNKFRLAHKAVVHRVILSGSQVTELESVIVADPSYLRAASLVTNSGDESKRIHLMLPEAALTTGKEVNDFLATSGLGQFRGTKCKDVDASGEYFSFDENGQELGTFKSIGQMDVNGNHHHVYYWAQER